MYSVDGSVSLKYRTHQPQFWDDGRRRTTWRSTSEHTNCLTLGSAQVRFKTFSVYVNLDWGVKHHSLLGAKTSLGLIIDNSTCMAVYLDEFGFNVPIEGVVVRDNASLKNQSKIVMHNKISPS